MFDTKTNFLSYVDTKLWPFKSWRYQKIAKFWKAHNTPPRGPRAKKFWFSKFLPRGYLHAKNDQNRWDKGVKLLWSALEWAISQNRRRVIAGTKKEVIRSQKAMLKISIT